MYRIALEKNSKYEGEELIKVFLKPGEYEILEAEGECSDRNAQKRQIFEELSALTGIRPAWGVLTGVRPVKLTAEMFLKEKDADKVLQRLKNEYLVSDDKAALLVETYEYQQKMLGDPDRCSAGVYIGIPFCPTRCLYCSFTSNQKPESEIRRYLEALKTEIRFCGKRMKETGIFAESVYIGGGTPTTLSAGMLDDLLTVVEESFDLTKTREFTVEAGRPDTITIEKLRVIKNHGIERISINPQTMKAETLELIGRAHKPNEITEAFSKANDVRIRNINADLIAGLPGENLWDFRSTLQEIIDLNPSNITVHTLAVKRASRLAEQDKDFHYKQAGVVHDMLELGDDMLRQMGYRPYYLYRQKHMAGSFENIGWCKDDSPCIYNIRIMEEKQMIIALGAGGMSKMYYPSENRLERVPNVSNYEIYIDRLDEMLRRKEDNLFNEFELIKRNFI